MPPQLSVLFVVKNEADRLPRALETVRWADEIVVVDTGSEDATRELARAAGARVVEIPWEGYVNARNRALAEARHDWILFLDADERVSPALRDEMRAALERHGETAAGFSMPRLSTFLGRPVRHGTWYPDRKLRLARRSCGLRAEGGRVHERLVVSGPVARLAEPLLHDPYRDLSDAVRKTVVYARLSAEDRFERGARAGTASLVIRPALEFLRSFVWKLGFLDGSTGFAIALIHAAGYVLRAGFLIEEERRRGARVESAVQVEKAEEIRT